MRNEHCRKADSRDKAQRRGKQDGWSPGRADDARWKAGTALSRFQLADVPLILLKRSSGGGFFEQISDAFTHAGLRLRIVADCPEISAIFDLVRERTGVALAPIIPGQAMPDDLIFHAIAGVPDLQPFALIHPRGRRLLPAIHRAMEFCQSQLARS
ncbi:hypothetical protein DM806_18405 [Sphingobium lactosutens]|uniref:LysR family transcriptional regulator substrate-binding protein n=1 Tax=Sphingobium lactosutens TaxID=522773 RepID=UPI0015C154D0|nr:LysR family transcriptional regulator substrate-binding protein [Sphingobium lactosutens]NWK97599.1 hypothetical protein [Sphingobium lactosutens]